MGNELPDLWWLMSPAFIQHAVKELALGDQQEDHELVVNHYTDYLVNHGYLKDARNGRKTMGYGIFDGSYVSYQQKLLQTVSNAKVGEPKQLMHILIEIPQDADNFVYMQRITEITKGVLSFVNVRITFIGFSMSTFTMDL